MSVITNYWPDPRFTDINAFNLVRCKIKYSSQRFDPSTSMLPGITLETTDNGDNWVSRVVSVPVGTKLVLACRSSGDQTSFKQSMSVYEYPSNTFLANCPLNGGVSSEFTAPASLLVTFRAAKTTGGIRNISNVFLGTKSDYTALLTYVSSGFLAGDLMPKD